MLKNKMRVIAEVNDYVASSTSEPGFVYSLTSGDVTWGDGVVDVIASASGTTPIGVNKWYVSSVTDNQLLNVYRGDQLQGHPVTLITKGVISTTAVTGDPSSSGERAYLANSGYIGTYAVVTSLGTVGTDITQVGRFLSAKDSDGYVIVEIDL